MLKTFLQHSAVVLCKKRLQKTANIREMRAFWKWPKMATKQRLQACQNHHFGSKIKNAQKNMLETFLQHIAVVLWKKKAPKTASIREMRAFWKWPPSKGYRLGKIVTLGQKLKMHKNMLKTFLQHIAVVLWKKRLQKTASIRKMRAFWKWPPSKGYRLGKIVTLGQKLKMHKNMLKTFLQHIAVVPCKKRLQKTANIREMRAFWKWPNMATKQRL